MGFSPARAKHSEIGRTPRACQDSMNRISSSRAAAASSEPRTAPATSSRHGCPPDAAPRPPECSDAGEAGGSSNPRKSEMSSVVAQS
eukprot:4825365-Alexandrium_andersonii.AAC.1